MIKIVVAGLAVALTVTACASTVSGSGTLADSVRPAGRPSSSITLPSSSPSAGGGSNASLSGAELEKAAKAAFTSAHSFHMSGTGHDGSTTLHFDLHYGEDSSQGSMTIGGAAVQLLYVAPSVYFMGTDAFWRQSLGPAAAAVVAQLHGKWVRIPSGSVLSPIATIAVRTKFLAEAAASPDNSTYSRGPSTTIRGVPAVSFVDDGDQSTIYVPASGAAFPLRIVSTGSDPGSFELTDWNIPFTAAAPPADQIIDLPH
jgi:hypothetical protein